MNTEEDGLDINWLMLFSAWLMVTGASLGSLFFSEVMELAPCKLCWYQRIFMFPLPFVLGMGLLPFDPRVARFALPLPVLGAAVALYHVLLQFGVIPESAAPCQQGVSCADVQLTVFGFVSIPGMSLLCFATVITLLFTLTRRSSR